MEIFSDLMSRVFVASLGADFQQNSAPCRNLGRHFIQLQPTSVTDDITYDTFHSASLQLAAQTSNHSETRTKPARNVTSFYRAIAICNASLFTQTLHMLHSFQLQNHTNNIHDYTFHYASIASSPMTSNYRVT